MNRDGGGDAGDAPPPSNDDLTPEELAAYERMRTEAPPQTEDAPGDDAPPPEESDKGEADKASSKAAAKADGEESDEELEDEITIDAQGKAHDASGKYIPKKSYLVMRDKFKTERDARTKAESRLDLLITKALENDPTAKPTAEGERKAPENPFDEEDIDPEKDPFAANLQERRRNKFLYSQQNASRAQQGVRDARQETINAYAGDARRLAGEQMAKGETVEVNGAKVPAFKAALDYLIELRHAQLEAEGYEDKAERDAAIAQEEFNLVNKARTSGKSPAEVIYKFAKASGWRMPETAKPNGEARNSGTGDAKERIQTLNKNMQATRSLGSGGGGNAVEGLTTRQIANMSDDEFNAFADKIGPQKLRALLGG